MGVRSPQNGSQHVDSGKDNRHEAGPQGRHAVAHHVAGAHQLVMATVRTTLCEIFSSRQIDLIGLPRTKCARRILAIVATISNPKPAPPTTSVSIVNPSV